MNPKRWLIFHLARVVYRIAGEPPAERQAPSFCARRDHEAPPWR